MESEAELNGFKDGMRVTVFFNKGKRTVRGWIRGIWALSDEDPLPIYVVSDEGQVYWADPHGHILRDDRVTATISPEF